MASVIKNVQLPESVESGKRFAVRLTYRLPPQMQEFDDDDDLPCIDLLVSAAPEAAFLVSPTEVALSTVTSRQQFYLTVRRLQPHDDCMLRFEIDGDELLKGLTVKELDAEVTKEAASKDAKATKDAEVAKDGG